MKLENCIRFIEEHNKEIKQFCNSFDNLNYSVKNPKTCIHQPSLQKEKEGYIVKYFKIESTKGICSTVINGGSITINTRLLRDNNKFLTTNILGNSILGSTYNNGKIFFIRGGDLHFCIDRVRYKFSTMQKDEYFNLSLIYNMPSYSTFELIRDLLPYVPQGSRLYFKELFNE